MTPENIERLTAEIKENYTDVATAKDGSLTLVRLPEVHPATSLGTAVGRSAAFWRL